MATAAPTKKPASVKALRVINTTEHRIDCGGALWVGESLVPAAKFTPEQLKALREHEGLKVTDDEIVGLD